MTFYILDPNIAHIHGHHFEWDRSIAEAAIQRDSRVVLLSHRDLRGPLTSCMTVVPHFSHTTYELLSDDVIAAKYDDFRYFNANLFQELSALEPRDFNSTDIVFVPTVTDHHILAYIKWMKTFSAVSHPRFVIHLMFPSSTSADGRSSSEICDHYTSLFYRIAFRIAMEPGPEISFFGAGTNISAHFADLAGFPIEPFPIPICPRRLPEKKSKQRRSALLFAGDAKIEKGFLLLPLVALALSEMHCDWDFIVHANLATVSGVELDAYESLKSHAEKFHNLVLHIGRLDTSEYYALLNAVDCAVFLYDSNVYRQKSSGIVWECISLGIPMVVPGGTWLDREAAEWGAGYYSYSQATANSVDAICRTFRIVNDFLTPLKRASDVASMWFQAKNGAAATTAQIYDSLIKPKRLLATRASGDGPGAFANYVNLDAFSIGAEFSHLDLSLMEIAYGPAYWPHVKFKLCLTTRGCEIEFRQGDGWPKVLFCWDDAIEDEFGLVMRFRDDAQLGAVLQTYRHIRDQILLRAVVKLLPIALHLLSSGDQGLPGEGLVWMDAAQTMSRNFLNVMNILKFGVLEPLAE